MSKYKWERSIIENVHFCINAIGLWDTTNLLDSVMDD